MYHSVIGKRLVECVNRRDGTAHTVRGFFDSVYIPMFFGSARMLQNVNNSPFDQAITKQKKPFTSQLQADCLNQVHSKVQGQAPDASFFLGGPASGSTETTSGQVTSMRVPVSEEDIYASWIGAALGLTVQGGMILLIDAEDVLLATYDGWSKYREFLKQTPTLKPLQVNAWNGQWVAAQMQEAQDFYPTLDKDQAALETQKWVRLLFAFSYHYRGGPVRRLLAYVYSLGQSNTTLGFVQLNLSEIRRPAEIYKKLFTVPPGMPAGSDPFVALYETAESFRFACTRTEIGLRALKPKDVFNAEKAIPKAPKNSEAEKRIAFDTYRTWIIAMLKNEELMKRAEELVVALKHFEQQGSRLKTGNRNMVNDLLTKKNKRDFIESLTTILQEDASNRELFHRAVNDLLSLSADNVPLFLTLLRFQYAAPNPSLKEIAQ